MAAFIRSYAGRIAGALAAMIGVLLVNWGIDIDPDSLAGFQAFAEALLVGVGLLLYGLVHKFLDGLLRKEPKDE